MARADDYDAHEDPGWFRSSRMKPGGDRVRSSPDSVPRA